MATVKITAKKTDHQWPTVNIVTTKAGHTPTHKQVTGTVAAGTKQFYDSGGAVQGLKTIHIAGYSAPG